VTDTLPQDSQSTEVLLDELRRLSPILYARFIAQCRTVVVNLVLEEDRIPESHGERRTGGLEPIPADMPGALGPLRASAPVFASTTTPTLEVLSPAAALELVGKGPGDDYFESGLHRPGSWEWHESRPGEARERLREQGYKPVKDTARPWRVLWTKSS